MLHACFLFCIIIAAISSLERSFWNWYGLIKPHKNNKTTTASKCEMWTALESSFAQVCPHTVPGSPCRIQFSSPHTTEIFSMLLGRTYCHLQWEKSATHSNYTFVQQHRGTLIPNISYTGRNESWPKVSRRPHTVSTGPHSQPSFTKCSVKNCNSTPYSLLHTVKTKRGKSISILEAEFEFIYRTHWILFEILALNQFLLKACPKIYIISNWTSPAWTIFTAANWLFIWLFKT